MARGKPVGTCFAEIDLDSTKLEQALKKTHDTLISGSIKVEDAYKSLGIKSDQVYNMMRANATAAVGFIKNKTLSSNEEIARAQKAAADKIKSINEQQYGAQTSLIDSLKQNWMALSAVAVTAYMSITRAFSEGRGIASAAMEIGKMAQISGLSTDQFQKFAYAAKMSDVESESLAVGMKRLAKNMEESSQGTGDAKKWFDVMGISVKDLNAGGLKPLDQMMGELSDKFIGWEDGTRKIAIATALFGRSGEALIPMLNKGKSGLTEFYSEAERLGIVLSPDIVRKGQEAEDSFKRFEAQLKSFKLSLSPVVSEFAKYLGILTDVIAKGKELAFPPTPKGPAYTLTGQEKNLFSLWGIDVTRGAGVKRTPELWELFGSASMAEKAKLALPPELPKEYPISKAGEDLWKSFKEGEGIIKIIRGDVVEMVPVIKDYESWWDKTNMDLEKIQLQLKMVSDASAKWGAEEPLGLKPGEMMLEGTIYDVKFWERITKEIADLQLQQKMTTMPGTTGWGGEEPIGLKPGEMMMGGTKYSIKEYENQMKTTERFWDDITHHMGDSFSNNFIDLVNGGFKDMEGFVKRFGMDALSIMEKLIMNAMIFGNIMGEKNAEGGYGGIIGWLGGLFKGGGGGGGYTPFTETETPWGFFMAQHGFEGMVDRPTAFLAGERGREYVNITPESKMGKGGGQTVVNYYNSSTNTNINRVDAVDAYSFEQHFGPSVLKVLQKNKRLRGIMSQ